MKAGLFLCDHVPLKYQTKFGDYSDMFMQLFPDFEFKTFDLIRGDFPTDLDECDVYLATGSSHSVYEDLDWIKQAKKIIRKIYQQEKSFIGLCFGHQLLGEALGGKVEKSPSGWCVGVHEFTVRKQEPWMEPPRTNYNLLMMCQDQVVELPPNAQILAGNKQCPVGMFSVGSTMLGIQGHPEYSKAYDKLLMENRIERMGEEVVLQGIKSLEKELHTSLIHDWMMGFVKKNQR